MIAAARIVFESPRLWPLASAAALAVLVIVTWLYLPLVRAIGSPWRWALPALRCIALIALLISILKPDLIFSTPSGRDKTIIFLVDRSLSMGVKDLAFLATSRPATRASTGDMTRGSAYLAELALGLSIASSADLSRIDRVCQALISLGPTPGANARGLLGQFPPEVPLLGYTLAEDLQPLMSRQSDQPVDHLSIQPTGTATDLIAGLREALAKSDPADVQAIVLISDGRQTAGDASQLKALGGFGIPVYTVAAAAPADVVAPDVAIAEFSLPARCFVGESTIAQVRLRATGSEGAVISVSVVVDDKPALTRPALIVDGSAYLELPLRWDLPGACRVVASIPAPADAPTELNKRQERTVIVMADKTNVALFAGDAGWDYQYLVNALSRTPWVHLDKGVLPAGSGLPLSPEKILDLDVLVLNDVPPNALSAGQWEAAFHLADGRGGSVFLIAGEHLPLEYVGREPAASLLPFAPGQPVAWRESSGAQSDFRALPAPGSESIAALNLLDPRFELDGSAASRPAEGSTAAVSSALSLSALADANAAAWARLPPFLRYLDLPRLKPAARPLLIERGSSAPLLVENRVGRGRVFFLGMNETWRWRFKVGERDQDHFWLQMMRYAAPEPYAVHAGQEWLDASPIASAPGDTIQLRAKVLDAQNRPSTRTEQIVELRQQGGGVNRRITLNAAGQPPGRYIGTLSSLPVGNYLLRLDDSAIEDSEADNATSQHSEVTIESLASSQPLAATTQSSSVEIALRVAPNVQREMADLTGDEAMLQAIADSTGGRCVAMPRIGALPQLIRRDPSSQPHLVQKPLWDSFYLYSWVLGCLALEWMLRKRWGLA